LKTETGSVSGPVLFTSCEMVYTVCDFVCGIYRYHYRYSYQPTTTSFLPKWDKYSSLGFLAHPYNAIICLREGHAFIIQYVLSCMICLVSYVLSYWMCIGVLCLRSAFSRVLNLETGYLAELW